jgi:phosphatidylinositol-3-phosphatase
MKSVSTLFATIAIAGCANTSGNTNETCQALTRATADPAPAWTGSVFTIVMENKSRVDIFGSGAAPYINKLAKANAVAGSYHDSYVHPSEPNYIWMVSGENFGILDDNDPKAHSIDSSSHIADQLELAGLTWKTYQESMGEPCGLVSHGEYAAKHDPFVYFDDINGWDGTQFQPSPRCNEHVVDYSVLDTDIANNTIPKYAFITPNLINDMHDGSVQQGDLWLSNELPKIMATDAYQKGGVIFLLWDEGSGTFGPGDDPPFIAISNYAVPGFDSRVSYDTSSYLATVQQILGLDVAPCAKNPAKVNTMADLFTVPLTK